jgi:serine/threonine protein kinase
MGMVYKARHTQLDREAAVKVLSPSAMIAPDAIDLFQREARLASQINHPNSVFIYDYGNVSGALFYLVMEFIDGQSLDEIISPKGKPPRPLTIPRVLTLTRQICDVLDTAHSQGIVHRDIKPALVPSRNENGKDWGKRCEKPRSTFQ